MPQPVPLAQTVPEEELNSCIQARDIDDTHLDGLEASSVLRTNSYDYCSTCGSSADACNDGRHNHSRRTDYQLNGENLVEEWASWIQDTGIFREVEVVEVSGERWDMRMRLGGRDLRFPLFFNERDLREYEFEPASLEFGFVFLDHQFIPNRDYLFHWSEPIEQEDQFQNRLYDLVRRYSRVISASFVDEADVDAFRRMVRNQIRTYFRDSGYDVIRETSECAGCLHYDINPQGDDLLFRKTHDSYVEEIVICRCAKGEGYHLHRFIDDEITSVEEDEQYSGLLDHIEERIDTYIDIQRRKENATNLTNILVGAVTLLTSAIFVDGLLDITGVFSGYLPSSLQTTEIAFLIISLNIVLVALAVGSIILPYILDWRFSWSKDQTRVPFLSQ